VDALCVQGPAAGGHRGTWDRTALPDDRPLAELIAAVHEAVHAVAPNIPLIAAGGLRTASDVTQVLSLPSVAAGTPVDLVTVT